MAYVSRTDSLRRAEGQERHQSPAARCEGWPAQTGVIPAIGRRPAKGARDRSAECRQPIPECGHWGTPEPYAVRSVRCDARGFTFRSMTPGWRARRCWGRTDPSRTLQNYKDSPWGRGMFARLFGTTQRDWAFQTTHDNRIGRRECARERWSQRGRDYLKTWGPPG